MSSYELSLSTPASPSSQGLPKASDLTVGLTYTETKSTVVVVTSNKSDSVTSFEESSITADNNNIIIVPVGAVFCLLVVITVVTATLAVYFIMRKVKRSSSYAISQTPKVISNHVSGASIQRMAGGGISNPLYSSK